MAAPPAERAEPAKRVWAPIPRVDPQRWVLYFGALNAGNTKAEAARQAGIGYNTVIKVHSDPVNSSGLEFYKQWLIDGTRDVYAYNQLSREAKKAHDDFETFRLRYFGHKSMPWHVETAEIIVKALASDTKEYLVINCPPGSGKSTLLTHDIILWALIRNRSMRVFVGTGAQTTGADYVQKIRNSLDRILPLEGDENDKAMGLAVDARQTLLHDFGRFKPDGGHGYWRADKFVLARAGGQPAHNKEASVVAFGRKSEFLGGRFNLVVWDDVVTDANSRTATQQAELARWWKSTAETRLEPGGVLVLMGQRMGAHDLYRHALDQRDIADVIDVRDYDPENLPGKYTHIKFPAHDEEKCAGGDSTHKDHEPKTARPWPKGCLLDPKRLTYKDLRVIEYNDPRSYATVYQQEDTDPGSVLVDPLWIKGGQDPLTGVMYPGCWDTDRHLGQFPDHLSGDLYSVVCVDPSSSNFWGVTWWLYQVETDFHHLIDLRRERMRAPELLHRDFDSGEYTGLLESWWQKGNDVGRPITHVIVETNAAQTWLLQYDHAKTWSSARAVDLVRHDTYRNKSDPKLGVTALAPHYRHGKVRLPGHWVTRKPVMALYNEVTRYPDAATTDLLMSHWFLLWNAPRLFTPQLAKPYTFSRPDFVQGARRGLRMVAS